MDTSLNNFSDSASLKAVSTAFCPPPPFLSPLPCHCNEPSCKVPSSRHHGQTHGTSWHQGKTDPWLGKKDLIILQRTKLKILCNTYLHYTPMRGFSCMWNQSGGLHLDLRWQYLSGIWNLTNLTSNRQDRWTKWSWWKPGGAQQGWRQDLVLAATGREFSLSYHGTGNKDHLNNFDRF